LYKFKIENRLALELNSIFNIKVNKDLLFNLQKIQHVVFKL